MLRVLLLRLGALSTDAERTLRLAGRCFVLYAISYGRHYYPTLARLAGSRGTSLLAWIPHAAILAGLFTPTPIRVVIWTVALIWMGAARVLNARQCGRTHCRYTGPYYLAMIVPVLILGSGVVLAGIYGWAVRCGAPIRPLSEA